jgi:Cu(I)/Ag(I) efflux system protein CusF
MSYGRFAAMTALAAGLSVTHAGMVVDGWAPGGSALCSGAAQAQESAATGVFHGVGVVKGIDAAKGWLTLDHGDIKGFMSAMVMMYRTDPPTLVAGLRVGDKVAFDIDAAHSVIVGVTVIERAP